MRHCFRVFISSAICAAGALGQVPVLSNSGPNSVGGSAHFGAPMPFGIGAVTGAPYSGEQVSEDVQTLADGTHITRKSAATKIYRDSFGRTRTERPANGGLALPGRIPDSTLWIEITDPVARVKYVLDPTNKVAHRQQLPVPPEIPARGAMSGGGIGSQGVITSPGMGTIARNTGTFSGTLGGGGGRGGGMGQGGEIGLAGSAGARPADMPQMSQEKLGTQSMEGVLADGTRTTRTFPVGSQGNDRPISVVSEMWMSPELKVMILSKTSDPRSGDHIQKLTNIITGEPSATLFQPPPEYTVVDESGAFTIKWGTQQ
jgi:hypothetical protein